MQPPFGALIVVFPLAPKKGMVKFPGKGHFKRVTTGEEGTLNAWRQAKRAFLTCGNRLRGHF